jgi:hypothetical protein
VQFTTSGGRGNADLYVRFGARPTTTVYQCRGTTADSSDKCTINSPAPGVYYVMVHAASSYERLTLRGTY